MKENEMHALKRKIMSNIATRGAFCINHNGSITPFLPKMLTMNFRHNSSLSIKITIPFLRRLACCGLVMAFPTAVTTAFADDNPEYPDFYSGKNSGGD